MCCWTSPCYFGLFQSENRIDLKMKWPLIQKLISNSSNSLKVKPEKARKWISSGLWETCAITQQSSPSLPRSSHPSHAWAYQGGTYKFIFCPQNSSLTIFCYECLQKKLVTNICRQTFSPGHRFSSSLSSSRGTWTCSPTSSRCTTPRSRSSSSSPPRPTSTWSLSNTQGQSHQIWTHLGRC